PPPPPTVDILANGVQGPITIAYNATASLSWTSTNATSCTVTPGSYTGTSNTGVTTAPLTASTTFTINCTGAGGTATDGVTVDVTPPPTVDILANGVQGPVTIAYNATASL